MLPVLMLLVLPAEQAAEPVMDRRLQAKAGSRNAARAATAAVTQVPAPRAASHAKAIFPVKATGKLMAGVIPAGEPKVGEAHRTAAGTRTSPGSLAATVAGRVDSKVPGQQVRAAGEMLRATG